MKTGRRAREKMHPLDVVGSWAFGKESRVGLKAHQGKIVDARVGVVLVAKGGVLAVLGLGVAAR